MVWLLASITDSLSGYTVCSLFAKLQLARIGKNHFVLVAVSKNDEVMERKNCWEISPVFLTRVDALTSQLYMTKNILKYKGIMAHIKWINSSVLHNALSSEGIPDYMKTNGINSVFTLKYISVASGTVPRGAVH